MLQSESPRYDLPLAGERSKVVGPQLVSALADYVSLSFTKHSVALAQAAHCFCIGGQVLCRHCHKCLHDRRYRRTGTVQKDEKEKREERKKEKKREERGKREKNMSLCHANMPHCHTKIWVATAPELLIGVPKYALCLGLAGILCPMPPHILPLPPAPAGHIYMDGGKNRHMCMPKIFRLRRATIPGNCY